MHDFLFSELATDSLTDGHPFDGVAFGTFTDALGREVDIKADDAEAILANTLAAIQSTRTESGELVGLPIDTDAHNHQGGAGWIVGAELVGGVLRLIPKWTKIGRELIGEGIRRFFSPTIDLDNNVVLGGSLTNWPASRNEKGHVMLRPIELSQHLFFIGEGEQPENDTEVNMTVSLTDLTAEERAGLVRDLITEMSAGDGPPEKWAELMRKQSTELAEKKYNEMVADFERKRVVSEFAKNITGGTQGNPRGIPVPIETVESFLMTLDANQLDNAKEILNHITKTGLVDFSEKGHGKRVDQKQEVPDFAAGLLRDAIKAGNSVAEFFELAGLGDPSAYDLSQFEEAK